MNNSVTSQNPKKSKTRPKVARPKKDCLTKLLESKTDGRSGDIGTVLLIDQILDAQFKRAMNGNIPSLRFVYKKIDDLDAAREALNPSVTQSGSGGILFVPTGPHSIVDWDLLYKTAKSTTPPDKSER